MSRPFRIALVAILAFLCILVVAISAPENFPAYQAVTIPQGATVNQAASLLYAKHIIRSPFLYKVSATILGRSNGVRANSYLFSSPETVIGVAYRTVKGESGFPPIKVVFPEGIDTADMAKILASDMPGFDTTTFLADARPHEGYLFPDTYYFTAADTPISVIKALSDNFSQKEASIRLEIAAYARPLAQVITMASIVEREATSTADRQLIAGILWKRLDAGMPLQVDPPFYYVLNKDGVPLTEADLKIDSPYNTYEHAGLPPTPIGNPGLDAIESTVTPTASPYWYYISGTNGATHYAATLDQQNANIRKYIN